MSSSSSAAAGFGIWKLAGGNWASGVVPGGVRDKGGLGAATLALAAV
jgi:hypothetical protein